MSRHISNIVGRLYFAAFVIAAIVLISSYYLSDVYLKVERPEWIQGNKAISNEEVLEYVKTGFMFGGKHHQPPEHIPEDTSIEELKIYDILEYRNNISQGVVPIFRYRDVYSVAPGDGMYIMRIVDSSEKLSVRVNRRLVPIGKPEGRITYSPRDSPQTTTGKMELVEYRVGVDECTIPGRYRYIPDATFEVSLWGQSILTKRYHQTLPSLEVFVREDPQAPRLGCLSSRPYLSYYSDQIPREILDEYMSIAN